MLLVLDWCCEQAHMQKEIRESITWANVLRIRTILPRLMRKTSSRAKSYKVSISLIRCHAVQSNKRGVTSTNDEWVKRSVPMGNSMRGSEMQPIEACSDRRCVSLDTMVQVNTYNWRRDSIKYCWLSLNVWNCQKETKRHSRSWKDMRKSRLSSKKFNKDNLRGSSKEMGTAWAVDESSQWYAQREINRGEHHRTNEPSKDAKFHKNGDIAI